MDTNSSVDMDGFPSAPADTGTGDATGKTQQVAIPHFPSTGSSGFEVMTSDGGEDPFAAFDALSGPDQPLSPFWATTDPSTETSIQGASQFGSSSFGAQSAEAKPDVKSGASKGKGKEKTETVPPPAEGNDFGDFSNL